MGQFGLGENADYLKTKLCRIQKTINCNFNVNITRIKDRPFILTSRHGLRLDITVRKRSGQM